MFNVQAITCLALTVIVEICFCIGPRLVGTPMAGSAGAGIQPLTVYRRAGEPWYAQ